MLAKPEYSSPPDEVCCRQGRCGEAVAGRGAVAKLLQAGDRRHRGLLAGALQRRAIGKMLLAGSAMAKRMAALWQRAIGKSCWQGRLGRVASRGAMEDRGKRARQLAPARKATCRKGAPSGRRCWQGRCSEEPSGSRQGNSPSCRHGKSTPRCKRTKKRAAKPTLLSPL